MALTKKDDKLLGNTLDSYNVVEQTGGINIKTGTVTLIVNPYSSQEFKKENPSQHYPSQSIPVVFEPGSEDYDLFMGLIYKRLKKVPGWEKSIDS